MTPNPILKVLSTFRRYKVRCLLIGGQACIVYGAAEFSRDSDFVVLSSVENLANLEKALGSLKAEQIYLPPLELDYLKRGHACHFRCTAGDVKGLRVDVISKMRGCDSFEELWKRKKTVTTNEGVFIDVIGVRDLVQSKKTQRDKDWLMLKRLVENDIILNEGKPSKDRIRWWLTESRDQKRIVELTKTYPKIAEECINNRPLISSAIAQDMQKLKAQLEEEELTERQKDIEYWAPLKKELEVLRHRQNR